MMWCSTSSFDKGVTFSFAQNIPTIDKLPALLFGRESAQRRRTVTTPRGEPPHTGQKRGTAKPPPSSRCVIYMMHMIHMIHTLKKAEEQHRSDGAFFVRNVTVSD